MANSRRPWLIRIDDVRARSWHQLRTLWIDNCPTERQIGLAPALEIQELQSLSVATRELITKRKTLKPPRSDHEDLEGTREGLLVEGMFLLRKAANVLVASELDFSSGFRTWSCSASYQAAFFAMRALLCLLGVTVFQVDGNCILLDVCAEPKNAKQGHKSLTLSWLKTGPPEHKQYWHLFHRCLRITEFGLVVPARWVGALTNLQVRLFSHQRNSLHYRANAWLFDDLDRPRVNPDFARFEGSVVDGSALEDSDRDDFTVALAFSLVRMAELLVSDLSRSLTVVREEHELFRAWNNVDCHRYYVNEFVE